MDARDLDNFFVSRGVEPQCPICGEDKWAPVDEDEATMLIPARVRDGSLGQGIDVMLIICLQCGFVSPHAKEVLTGKTERRSDH